MLTMKNNLLFRLQPEQQAFDRLPQQRRQDGQRQKRQRGIAADAKSPRHGGSVVDVRPTRRRRHVVL